MFLKRFKFPAAVLLVPAITAILILSVIDSSAKTLPFNGREKFVYKAKWSGIEAGEAVVESLPFEYVNGRRFFHFVMTAQTNSVIDYLYVLRDRQDSYVDQDFTHSVQYEQRTMGKNPREAVVYFNWKQMNATYVNFGEPQKPVSIVPGTFDPLSLFFAIRTHDLREGNSIQIPITDGKKLIPTKARVKGREKIVVNERTYDTYVVVPDFDMRKAFEKDQANFKFWITADERRIPVKIESRLKFGKIVLELVSAVL
jgi:hypothetical protein